MILNFKIKNFRSIKDEIILDLQATSDKTWKKHSVFEIDKKIALLKSVVIYGPNASGKSNIFKALVIFRMLILESQLRSNNSQDLPNEYFKLSSETENKPSSFELEFLLDKDIFKYGFAIDKKRITGEWLKQVKGNKILFERKGQNIKSNKNYFREATTILKKQTPEKVLFLSVLASNNGHFSQKIIKLVQNINYISDSQRAGVLNFSFGKFINNTQIAQKMKEFVIKADFGIVDILASEKKILGKDIQNIPDKFKELLFKEDSKIAERSLKFLHKKYDIHNQEVGREPLDFFTEESEGTQQLFALSAPLIDTLENGKVLFIDELDASLHPLLSQYLISIFNSQERNKNNAQLIFITHDISLLKEEFFRRDQIYFTDKNKYGATELFSLADISERKGLDFSKRYLAGRYGALPYISDFENLKFSK